MHFIKSKVLGINRVYNIYIKKLEEEELEEKRRSRFGEDFKWRILKIKFSFDDYLGEYSPTKNRAQKLKSDRIININIKKSQVNSSPKKPRK